MTKQVDLETSQGTIRLELDDEKAPETVKNFLTNVENGHYDGTVFHRVIKGFMVQGGGFEPGMQQKPTGNTIENEASNGLKNERYTVAMARTSAPHSATAQFFINIADNEFLDFKSETAQGWGYTVFGKVVEGMDVVDAHQGRCDRHKGSHADVPTEDVVITRATVVSSLLARGDASVAGRVAPLPEAAATFAAPGVASHRFHQRSAPGRGHAARVRAWASTWSTRAPTLFHSRGLGR